MSATKKLKTGLAIAAVTLSSFAMVPTSARADDCYSGSSYCGSGGYSSGSSYDCGSSSYCGTSGGYSSGGYSSGGYNCGSYGSSYCGTSGGGSYSSGGYTGGGSSISSGQIVGLVGTGIQALGQLFGGVKSGSSTTINTGINTGVKTGVNENTVIKRKEIVREIVQPQIVQPEAGTEVIRVVRKSERALADTGSNA